MGMTSVIIHVELYVVFFRLWWRTKVWIYMYVHVWGNSDISPPTFWISYMPSSFECKQFGYINGISVLYNIYMYNLKIWNFPKTFLTLHTCKVCKGTWTDKRAKSSHNSHRAIFTNPMFFCSFINSLLSDTYLHFWKREKTDKLKT